MAERQIPMSYETDAGTHVVVLRGDDRRAVQRLTAERCYSAVTGGYYTKLTGANILGWIETTAIDGPLAMERAALALAEAWEMTQSAVA